MLTIKEIDKYSIGEELELQQGDKLLEINGIEVEDVLDYHFIESEEFFTMKIQRGQELFEFEVEKDQLEPIGLSFVEQLEIRTCHNKCIFCFVDQMAKDFRETLYCKDDDYRFSFISGNYITLTNDTEKEFERIKRLKLSPLYISVHATDPELRKVLLHNKFAGKIMEQLRELTEAGIEIHTQIVLCKGINDGEYLKKSLEDLYSLYPMVKSLAIVPVGMTQFREGLFEIPRSDKAFAEATINMVEEFSNKCYHKHKDRFVYCSDEFYCLAERQMPSGEFYGDYPQIENGIGLVRKFQDEFESVKDTKKEFDKKKTVLITGKSFEPYLRGMLESINCPHHVVGLKNTLFGDTVTVAGLLTGNIIMNFLKGTDYERVLLPQNVLREFKQEFLDNITLEQLKNETGKEIVMSENDGAKLLEIL